MNDKLNRKLEQRTEKGTLRSLSSFKGMIDFVSNDYLGFGVEYVELKGRMGSTGSRLISGNDNRKIEIEKNLANFYGSESGLLFNSGYDANLGFFSSVPQKDDVVLYDEYIHASVRDGLRLSLAKSFSFRHNDVEHLRDLIMRIQGSKIYVVVESIYSMNGDKAPLKKLYELCQKFEAAFIVDEAHAAGVFGEQGKGLCYNLIEPDVRLVTFGKAYGGHGAILLCSPDVRNYLINFARSFIYTTALPTLIIEHIEERITNENIQERQENLRRAVRSFRKNFREGVLSSDEDSPIQIIQFENEQLLRTVENELLMNNIGVKAIYPPTVPEGMSCLRICLHEFNTEHDIKQLCSIIKNSHKKSRS